MTGLSPGRETRKSVSRFLRRVSLAEILRAMGLTFRHLFGRAVTRQYPTEVREPFEGSRGLIALVRDPETGEAKCVGCGLCVAMCPSRCIDLRTQEGDDCEKTVEEYEIDVLKCLYCGLCIEACPYGALVMTGHFAFASESREVFYYNKEKLLAAYDEHLGESRGKSFLRKFWKPRKSDFT